MSPFFFIAISTVLGVSGQLLLKQGMNHIGRVEGTSFLKQVLLSPWVMGGLVIYGLGVIFWLMALSRFELSYVYPFASLSYIGIILGSYFLFKEKISLMRLVGIAVIVFGVILTSISVSVS
jgi:multidrug transporter EmrE-like cation transporter